MSHSFLLKVILFCFNYTERFDVIVFYFTTLTPNRINVIVIFSLCYLNLFNENLGCSEFHLKLTPLTYILTRFLLYLLNTMQWYTSNIIITKASLLLYFVHLLHTTQQLSALVLGINFSVYVEFLGLLWPFRCLARLESFSG